MHFFIGLSEKMKIKDVVGGAGTAERSYENQNFAEDTTVEVILCSLFV